MCTAIQECRAEVTAVLSGSVASAGTIIALACDKIECDFSLEFMIHMLSGGTVGKANEMKAHGQFMTRHYPELFKRIYKDFLTESEIELIIEGKDIWLDGDEVLERWNRMVA
jgi:ATP-dependent protease ClpP protease subunit